MGEFTDEDEKVLKQLKAICQKRGPRLKGERRWMCALLKKQLDQENRIKQMELDAIARSNLVNARLNGLAYVTRQINALQTQGTLLLAALTLASGEYDKILAARAAKPIAPQIAVSVLMMVLPELKIVGRSINFFIPKASSAGRALFKSSSKSTSSNLVVLMDGMWNTVQLKTDSVTTKRERLIKFGEILDGKTRDIAGVIREPFKANEEIDRETAERFKVHSAKNAILSRVMREIQRTLVMAGHVEFICHMFLMWYDQPDLKQKLEGIFKLAGLDEDAAYPAAQFDLFDDLVLYDMLRAYVKSYVTLSGVRREDGMVPNRTAEHVPVEGLDKAQMQEIFNRFGTVPWKDASRPAVQYPMDFFHRWGATFQVFEPRGRETVGNMA